MSDFGQSGLKKPATLIALGQNMSGGNPDFDPAYQAILDYAISQGYGLPSIENQYTQNALLKGELRSATLWDQLDVFYNFFTDGSADFAKINWKAPGTFQATIAGVVPFTPLSGFLTNENPVNIINTNFNPSINAVNYTLNDASFGGDNTDILPPYFNTPSKQYVIIPVGTVINQDMVNNGTSIIGINQGANRTLNPGQITGGGLLQLRRILSNSYALFKDGALFQQTTEVSTALPNGTFQMFGQNCTCRMMFLGASLQGLETTLYNTWNDYKHATVAAVAYRKIIDYATLNGYTLPSPIQRIDQIRLIEALSRSGAWDEFDIFYNFVNDAATGDFAKINWKNPGTFQAVGTGHEPTFVENQGFLSVANSYLDTTWNPAVDAVKSSLNSILISISSINPAFVQNAYHGAQVSPNRLLINLNGASPNQVYALMNVQGGPYGATNPAFTPAPGLYQFWREDATGSGVKARKDSGADIVIGSDVSSAIPSASLFILAYNNSGAPVFTTPGLSVSHFGVASKMDATKRTGFANAWKIYFDKYYIPPHPYEAVLAYATAQGFTLPSLPQQTLQRQLVTDLMTAGIWDQLDVFYNFLTDGDHNFAKINWKAPGTYQAVGTGHEPTFIPNFGFTGFTVNNYLDSTFTPSIALGKFSLNSSSLIYDSSGVQVSIAIAGGCLRTSPTVAVSSNPFSGTYLLNMVTAEIPTISGGNVSGLSHLNYDAGKPSNKLTFFKNGVSLGGHDHTISVLAPASIYIGARNDAVEANYPWTGEISVFAFGASLTGKELDLYNVWNTYSSTVRSKAAYKAIIDYATLQGYTLPSVAQQTLQEKLIYDLMIARIWDELDVFYNFLTDGDADFAKINWKAPGTFQADSGTLVFSPLNGFTGVSSLLTNWIPSLNGVKYTLNNAGVFMEFTGPLIISNFAILFDDTANSKLFLEPRRGGDVFRIRFNTSATDIQGASLSQGLYHTEVNEGRLKIFKDGVGIADVVNTPNFLPTTAIRFHISLPNTTTTKMVGIGASLAGKETALYNAWLAYKTP